MSGETSYHLFLCRVSRKYSSRLWLILTKRHIQHYTAYKSRHLLHRRSTLEEERSLHLARKTYMVSVNDASGIRPDSWNQLINSLHHSRFNICIDPIGFSNQHPFLRTCGDSPFVHSGAIGSIIIINAPISDIDMLNGSRFIIFNFIVATRAFRMIGTSIYIDLSHLMKLENLIANGANVCLKSTHENVTSTFSLAITMCVWE